MEFSRSSPASLLRRGLIVRTRRQAGGLLADLDVLGQRLVRQHRTDGGDVAPLIARHLLDFLQPFEKGYAGHGVAPLLVMMRPAPRPKRPRCRCITGCP